VATARVCGIVPGALIGGCDPPQLASNAAARTDAEMMLLCMLFIAN